MRPVTILTQCIIGFHGVGICNAISFQDGSVMEIKLVFQNVMYRHIESEPKFKEKRFEVDEANEIGQLFTVGRFVGILSAKWSIFLQ